MNTLTLNQKTYTAHPAQMHGIALAFKEYPSCKGCAFDEDDDSCKSAQTKIHCVAEYRPDNRNIIWIEQNGLV